MKWLKRSGWGGVDQVLDSPYDFQDIRAVAVGVPVADTGADARPLVLLGIAWLAPVNSLLPSISAAKAARRAQNGDDVGAAQAEAEAAAREREDQFDALGGGDDELGPAAMPGARIRGGSAEALQKQSKEMLDRGIDPFFVPPVGMLPPVLRNALELSGRLHSLRRTAIAVPVLSKTVTSGGIFTRLGNSGSSVDGAARAPASTTDQAGKDTDSATLKAALSARTVNHAREQRYRMV